MFNKFVFLFALVSVFVSCNTDDSADNIQPLPTRDRADVQRESDSAINSYLATHFYNYEEFAIPADDFNYKIVFDTISGENISKTPLSEQVETKRIVVQGVEEKLYILKVREGAGAQTSITSNTLLNYVGLHLNNEQVFDKSDGPVSFNLSQTISGFGNGVADFRGASTATQETNGTTSYSNDYGIGASFVPAGLGYYSSSVGPIAPYENLIFTFDVLQVLSN